MNAPVRTPSRSFSANSSRMILPMAATHSASLNTDARRAARQVSASRPPLTTAHLAEVIPQLRVWCAKVSRVTLKLRFSVTAGRSNAWMAYIALNQPHPAGPQFQSILQSSKDDSLTASNKKMSSARTLARSAQAKSTDHRMWKEGSHRVGAAQRGCCWCRR